jgi:hypothetical protein
MVKIQVMMMMKTSTHQPQNHGAEPLPGSPSNTINTVVMDTELTRDSSAKN